MPERMDKELKQTTMAWSMRPIRILVRTLARNKLMGVGLGNEITLKYLAVEPKIKRSILCMTQIW